MKEKKKSKKRKKIVNQLGILFGIFVVAMLTIASIATYRRQSWIFNDMCTQTIMDVGDYLTSIILAEGDDFTAYTEYYRTHYDEMRIPCDLSEYNTARKQFTDSFAREYPGKVIGRDVQISEMSEELLLEYYTYRHEYWLLTFEQARKSFNLPYTYFLLPDETTHNVVYMIDGERTEDENHPGYLYMGDAYYNEPERYAVLWKTWSTGQKQEEVMEFDNSWGHTYAYYTPLVIDGNVLGLVTAEINVDFIRRQVVRSTIMLCLRLGGSLLIFSSLLLFTINRRYIKKINFLSGQIDSFSSTRAPETVDAIRDHSFEKDELGALASNTADMIVEVKEHEDAIQRAADMKSDFLANMSHEIRTPMNAVVGMSELMLREDIPDKVREYALQIKSSGNALLTVINDILDFSKIESGNVEIIPEDYEPATLIEEVLNIGRLNLGKKNIEIRSKIDPALPRVLRGDSIRIRQILINIFNNAIKFTKEGYVELAAEWKESSEGERLLVIKVTDTGIGIKEKDLERIFESFSQVISTRNREVEGTGLGLAITRQLIDRMNGTINVQSEYGKGSCFTVTIPQEVPEGDLVKAGPDNSDISFAGELVIKNADILVVDDNSVNLIIMKGLLEPYGIIPVTVLSGAEAIEEAGKKKFDLVFMDHMMPIMDGVEATKIIREKYPEYKDVPIIAFTANAVGEARNMLMDSGMNDFVSKPVEPDKIRELLIKWLPEDKKRQ